LAKLNVPKAMLFPRQQNKIFENLIILALPYGIFLEWRK
jgi:hypothetical protein